MLHKLMELIQYPDSALNQIDEFVTYEPATTAILLKVCNSAHMGLSVKVDSVDQAVS